MLYKSECSTIDVPVIPKNSKVIGMHRVAHYLPVLYISAINDGGRIVKQYKIIARSIVTGRYIQMTQLVDGAIDHQCGDITKMMWLELCNTIYNGDDI